MPLTLETQTELENNTLIEKDSTHRVQQCMCNKNILLRKRCEISCISYAYNECGFDIPEGKNNNKCMQHYQNLKIQLIVNYVSVQESYCTQNEQVVNTSRLRQVTSWVIKFHCLNKSIIPLYLFFVNNSMEYVIFLSYIVLYWDIVLFLC